MTQRRIYQNEFPYFITFRTREGFRLFEDEEMAGLLMKIIFNAGALKQYDILVYQIMPDHVHLLVAIAGTETRDGRRRKKYLPNLRTRVSPPAITSKNKNTPAIAQPMYNISQLMYTIKSFFYKKLREEYDIQYSCLQPRFYARIIDTDKYLRTVIEYIKYNSIKAELPEQYQQMPYQYFDEHKIRTIF